MVRCAWRSWIGTISLWASAVTVAGASLAPAVKLMWMSAAPAPVFTAFAMTVFKKKNKKGKNAYSANMTLGMIASLHLNTNPDLESHWLLLIKPHRVRAQLQVIRVL